MLSKIDPSACDLIRSELNQAIESVQEKLGVRINIGNMTYSDCDVKTSLSVELAGAEEKPMRDLKRYMSLLDITQEDLETTFTLGSEKYKLTGYKPRARKNAAIITKVSNGKTYVTTIEEVKRGIAAAQK